MIGLGLMALALGALELASQHRIGSTPLHAQWQAWATLWFVGGGLAWAAGSWGLQRWSLPSPPGWVAGTVAGIVVLALGGSPLGAAALVAATWGLERWIEREQPGLGGMSGVVVASSPIALLWAWHGDDQLVALGLLSWGMAFAPALLGPAATFDPSIGLATLAMQKLPRWARVLALFGAIAGFAWRGALSDPLLDPARMVASFSLSSGWPFAALGVFVMPGSMQLAAGLALLGAINGGSHSGAGLLGFIVVGALIGADDRFGRNRTLAAALALVLVTTIGFTPRRFHVEPQPGILRVEEP